MIPAKGNCTATTASLLKALKQAIQKGEDSVLETERGNVFLILPAQNLFIEQAQVQAPATGRITPLLSRPADINLGLGRPLGELLWRMGFEAFDDAQCNPEGCRREDVIRLKRHPNLTRLPFTPNSARIAILLSSRPTSSVLAAKILRIDESEVIRFYCAANAAGYIDVVSRMVSNDIVAENKPTRANGLLGRIIDHLKGKSVSYV